jgi:hypothetical protein
MDGPFRPLGSPGVRLSLVLAALWVLSWILFAGLFPGARLAGLPLVTWSHILVGILAVAFGLVAIPLLERWESR